jgi:hypothetical protein
VAANEPADLGNEHRTLQQQFFQETANCLPASHEVTLPRGTSLEDVQSENRAVERLIRIGEVKRLTRLSTATSEKGLEVAWC